MIKQLLFAFLAFFLVSCAKTTNKVPVVNLPEMPLISKGANRELKIAFNPVCVRTKDYITKIKEAISEYKLTNEKENKEKIQEAEYLIAELNTICHPKSNQTKNWLSDIYVFKIKYEIYKEELEKY